MDLQIPSLNTIERHFSGKNSPYSSQGQTQQTTMISTVKSSLVNDAPISPTTKRKDCKLIAN
jgi:hypothetical protein